MIRRHSRSAICMHWFNAVCWIFLLFSGLALLAGEMQPVGSWWQGLWQGIFGERGLLVAHIAVGTVWVAVYALYLLVFGRREAFPFLKEVTTFHPASDMLWCMKKGMWLVLGPKRTKKLGVDPALPPQGFYNAGQRMVAVLAVLASLCLAVTGVVMAFFSGSADPHVSEAVLQWSIWIHFCAAAVMAVFLPVHIYMAALAPGEAPALRSMFTGFVPESHAEHHNPLWYEALKKTGKQSS
ncbi:MAG: cytochrome b/b6 domain-containing protein [Desulfovibrionaceae bacterium]|nr:cytochrome b/b6 domain-containing protein [Desulfovibrionaceae bacterium]